MRLLFLARELPLPANNGSRLREWAMIRAFAAERHELFLMAFARPGDAGEKDLARLRVHSSVDLVPLKWTSLSGAWAVQDRLRAVLDPLPYSVLRFNSAEMRRRCRLLLERRSVDAIVSDIFMAVNIPDTDTPLILNHHNVEHVMLRRYIRLERNPFKLGYAWLEYFKMRRWERKIGARARVGLACSNVDAGALSAVCPSLPQVVAPNVVDMDGAVVTAADESSTIVFQGGMDWLPNRDAVAFFASAIFPHIKALVPDATFLVAGRNPSPSFIASFGDIHGMSFTGTVEDMRVIIARAAISVAPLRIGSGTRLKIIEAAVLGKPIVSTSLGAEGLNFVNGEDILIADDPRVFAKHVADLLRDPSRRRALGTAARQRAERHYALLALQQALTRATAYLGPHISKGAGRAGTQRLTS